MTVNPIEDVTSPDETALLSDLQAAADAPVIEVVDWAGTTHVGLVRDENQDCWDMLDDAFFVVADGMGGKAGGATAARVAVASMLERYGRIDGDGIEEVVRGVNADVVSAGRVAATEELGTTLVAAAIRRSSAMVISVGDSRAYLLASGQLTQLSHDHNLRTELLESGVDPTEPAGQGVRLDALTSFIGKEAGPAKISVTSHSVRPGDRLLLCTDGAYRALGDAELRELMAAASCAVALTQLVDAALAAGGRDNITAIIIEFGEEGDGEHD